VLTAELQSQLKAILEGGLPGLALDTDLRWHIVAKLASRGAVSREQIDAELANDETVSGRLAHDYAISSLPDLSHKHQIWDELVSTDMNISRRTQKMTGIHQPHHREMMGEFVDRYFDSILKIWDMKSFQFAREFTEHMYPFYHPNQSTVDKTIAWLDGPGREANSTLRRYVNDGLDELRLCILAQAKDAEFRG
jgi:aminopeptidase N